MSGLAREILFFGIVLVSIFSIVNSEVVKFRPCPQENPDAPSNCTIHEVRINPCKDTPVDTPCRLKRGQNASIEFDYTPKFSDSNLEGRAFWVNAVMELPFMGMESQACLGTRCPTVANQIHTYNQTFPISKKYPIRTYDVKWVIATPQEQQCCFIFQIKIHK